MDCQNGELVPATDVCRGDDVVAAPALERVHKLANDVDSFVGKTPHDVWRYLFTAPEAGANRRVIIDALGISLRDAGLGFVVGR
jgi:hypothetical protein